MSDKDKLISPGASGYGSSQVGINVDSGDIDYSHEGLTTEQASQRLLEYGPNSVSEKLTPVWKLFLLKFWGPMPILIEIAAILAGINAGLSEQHDFVSFAVLVLLLLINGLIGFFEERNAGKAIAALKKTLAPKCAVRRDGNWITIDAVDLVPGDLIAMKLGDIVPADCRLVENGGTSIDCDESALTGESLPVVIVPGEGAKSGAIIRRGECEAVVTATGAKTYIGEAMELVGQEDVGEGHFQKVLFNIAKVIIVVALVLVTAILLYKVLDQQEQVLEVVSLALVLLVASIPIAMQVVCTSTMAVGSKKLAAHNVVVSRLGAIEELAGMTVLCSDKTGTLTKNQLQMREPWCMEGVVPNEITFFSALAAKRVNPDAIDLCIVNSCDDRDKLDDYQELDFLPFDPILKRTECTTRDPDGNYLKITKGAPQIVLNMASNREEIEEMVDNTVKDFAERGLRALGVARAHLENYKEGDEIDDDQLDWEFMGILSFHDPPREDTKQTIERAISMGSEVKMITGDHILIGRETARLLGMGQAFYGKEFLQAVDDGKTNIEGVDVGDIIEAADGFAQVAPKHKYFIVAELQKRGHITGMTGDGVNDAPALKKADIGIAVEGATEAAKSAADIVLLTPGLSVIITAILRSRKIFQRMKNYCIYRISCTFQLLLFFTIAIIGLNFSIPTVLLVFITILNDGTIMTIAYDNVIPSQKPEAWKLLVVTGISVTIGFIATIGLFGIFALYQYSPDQSGGATVFGERFSRDCYFAIPQCSEDSKGVITCKNMPFIDTNQSKKLYELSGGKKQNGNAFCNPTCGKAVNDQIPYGEWKDCGKYVGFSELISVVYLSLSVGGQLVVFVARTKHSFWSRRPGYTLLGAFFFAQTVATLLAVYWPVSLGISAVIGLSESSDGAVTSVGVVMNGLSPNWAMAGWIWLYSILLFFFEDLSKVYFYYSVDNDAIPSAVDFLEIKKEKRRFLPRLGGQKKRKSKKE